MKTNNIPSSIVIPEETPEAFSKIIFPIFKSIDPHEFVNVQPMACPNGLSYYLDFKYGCRAYYMDEELWLEDSGRFMVNEYYCPEISNDDYISCEEYYRMRDRELIFDDWEVKQQEVYVGGLGNEHKWFS